MTALIHKIRQHATAVTDIYAQLDRFISTADEILEHIPDLPIWAKESLEQRIGYANAAIKRLEAQFNPIDKIP
jgi:hypothetical protein